MAVKGSQDQDVRSWASWALNKAGNPKGPVARAEALLAALRKQSIWVPDPVHTELMPGAALMLGDGVNPAFYGGGDCDDLTIALLAAFLSSVGSMGVTAAVVGHSYNAERNISHVLAAVTDGVEWFYADPSTDFPFGMCKRPTRERIIEVPTLKMICDADVCLVGPRATRPSINTKPGTFIGVSGIEEILMPADELPYGASWLGSSPEDIVKGDIAEHLLGLSQMCAKSHADLLDSYDSSKSITDKLGVRLVDDVLWSESDEQLTVQVLAALTAASQMLLEASRGDRAVAVSADKHDILIDGVSTDMFWIVWGSNEHTFALQTPAGAEFVVPSTLGIVTLSDPGKVTHPAMAVGDAYRLTVLGDKLGALVRGSACCNFFTWLYKNYIVLFQCIGLYIMYHIRHYLMSIGWHQLYQ